MKKFLSLKNIYLLTTGFIAVFVGLVGGIIDITQPENLKVVAEHLGYPLYFFFLLGIFKILGAIALFFPFDKIKDLAYFGFAVDFVFASFSHYSVQDPLKEVLTPIFLLVLLLISYILKERLKTKAK